MNQNKPPRWADRFLEWYCHPDLLDEIQGDAYELFLRTEKENRTKANLAFIWNVIRFFRWKNIRRRKRNHYTNQATTAMLKNYFKIGFRNLMRHKAFSLINVLGLTIGLACFMMISAFIVDELSYDKYAANYKNIYRVGLQLEQNGGVDDYPNVDIAVAAGMKSEFPEIIESTRMTGSYVDYVQHEGANVKEESLVFADSNVLKIFSIPLLEGNASNALTEPNSIVISKAFAKKYFGDKPALGEMITFRRNGLLKVTGVFDQFPTHSHFHYNAFISITTNKVYIEGRQTWSNVGFYSYVILSEHADRRELEAKFPSLVEKYVVPEVQEDMGLSHADAQKSVNTWKFYLMPLEDIHLHSHTKYEIEANGDINTVYIFGALALFVLVLACINFMNLSTARSAKRALEIGIRKTLGSVKRQLIGQFLMESILLAMIALVCAVLLIFILLPLFNQITGKHIDALFFLSPQTLLCIVSLGLMVGLAAGIYPAMFLSSFQTLRVLKGNTGSLKRGGLRSALVVFQFAISTALIIATLIAYQQLHFMQNINLGYNKEQILVIENAGALRVNQIPFKYQLKNDHRIVQVSNSFVPIGTAASFGGSEVSAKENATSNIHISISTIDYDYLDMLDMKLITGRNFSREFSSDSLGTNVIINETAMRDLGWSESNVIGSTIVRSAQAHYQVVGVVRDFHYTSAKEKIAPLMLIYRGVSPVMLVKLQTNELQALIHDMEKQWNSFETGLPFSYYFMDDRFAHLYQSEQTTEQIFIIFMVIAIVIASLGLYGLSTYSAEQRIKEIGIRKVLGSSVSQIVLLQSREFVILVLVAITIAVPLSWWAMSLWLQNFGYRIQISAWIFILAGLAAIIIALCTVSFQAIKAALVNPVKSLKAE